MSRPMVICAGGTGGHMVPAHCLALALQARGVPVHLVTDDRGLRFPGLFPQVPRDVVQAGSTGRSGWRTVPQVAAAVLRGRAQARALYRRIGPRGVIGFGGYPSVPGLLGGVAARLPVLLHEQNAVLGRANRFLGRWARVLATSWPQVGRINAGLAGKVRFVGNPVRPEVLAAAAVPFDAHPARLRLLVTGGSQGAAVLNTLVPAAVALLPADVRARLDVVHQGRDEDHAAIAAAYAAAGVTAQIASYFPDLPSEMAASHLVVARSGASTVAELAVMGRPSILIPLPIATDDHQAANAAALVDAGAAQMLRQGGLDATTLASALQRWLADPNALAAAAAAAKSAGQPDAAERLADLVLEHCP
jgi:UDP-N-acetylglucosamine--N-acetylmuramyl-(pentapeptide) pyrophosphoryl-undecaprenol N-acetylglucosamine transferase